jgi:tetratricopeptide (TPR) repeat protein
MTDSINTKQLIERGQAAARVGRLEEARRYLREAVEREPDNVQAWLNLAGVENDPLEKQACFEAVLDLDPDNREAQLGLEMLSEGEEGMDSSDIGPPDEMEAIIAQASRKLEEAVGPPPADEIPLDDAAADDSEVLYCANHPTVETMLRCNRCGKPICTRCAVQTPVGYRCRECVNAQQSLFYSGGAVDYVIGALLALVLGGIASYLVTLLGAWFIALILGPTIGIGIAEAVRFAVRRRRSRYLWLVVAASIVVASIPALLVSFGSLWRLIAYGLFLVLAVGAASARLR